MSERDQARWDDGLRPVSPASASSPTPATRAIIEQLAAIALTRDDHLPMSQLFAVAKRSMTLTLEEIASLLEHDQHAVRLTAVSIMDFQARQKRLSPDQRRELFDLYRGKHDRISTWDMVDRAAPSVVGGYLLERSRQPLYELAASRAWYERRTAIVATWAFIRVGDVSDTFEIARVLAHDPEHLVQTAVGGWVREAGKRAPDLLREWLDDLAASLPRTTLRFAIEKLPVVERAHYRQQAGRADRDGIDPVGTSDAHGHGGTTSPPASGESHAESRGKRRSGGIA